MNVINKRLCRTVKFTCGFTVRHIPMTVIC